MAGMRDRLAHGYFEVHLPTLWTVATKFIHQETALVTAARDRELERRRAQEAKDTNGKKKNGGKG
jgi:uncharacterized protein with HEPN domain